MRPKFGTSYSIGIKDGWVSYLYSTLPTDATTSSDRIPLPDLLRSYRSLSTNAARHAVGHGLVYGRLYLPQSRLEALLATRVTPEINLTIRAVSQETLRHGGTALALASWDDPAGRFGIETLASSDGGVLGLRGLWNATNPPAHSSGTDIFTGIAASQPSTAIPVTAAPPHPSDPTAAATTATNPTGNNHNADKERINGRFSVGGEIYYGLLNKSGGLSLGGRFQTLPTHAGTPLTAALTFNLLGHFSATYAVMAGRGCTLASQFGFNLYSYESEWAVGVELWRPGGARKGQGEGDTSSALVDAAPAAGRKSGEAPGAVDGERVVDPADIPPQEVEAVLAARAGLDHQIDPSLAEAMQTRETNNNSLKTAAAASTAATLPAATQVTKHRSFQAKLEWRLDDDDDAHTQTEAYDPSTGVKLTATTTGPSSFGESGWHGDDNGDEDSPAGVVKCRCDQHMRVGLMYEGRYKSLLFSLGTDVDLRRLDAPFQGVGLAVQFSS